MDRISDSGSRVDERDARRLEALQEINALLDLGLQLQVDGRPEEARQVYERGRETARRFGDRLGECRVLRAMADMEDALGRQMVAEKLRAEIRDIYREGASTALRRIVGALDDPEAEARTLFEVAEVERGAGFPDRARSTYRVVLSRCEQAGDLEGQIAVLLSLADLSVENAEREEAQRILARVRSMAHNAGQPRLEADAVFRLARSQAATDIDAAAKLYEQAAALYDEADRIESVGRLRLSDPPLPEVIGDTRAFDSRVMARVARRERERLEEVSAVEPEPPREKPERRDWRGPLLDGGAGHRPLVGPRRTRARTALAGPPGARDGALRANLRCPCRSVHRSRDDSGRADGRCAVGRTPLGRRRRGVRWGVYRHPPGDACAWSPDCLHGGTCSRPATPGLESSTARASRHPGQTGPRGLPAPGTARSRTGPSRRGRVGPGRPFAARSGGFGSR